METFSALLATSAGNSPVTGEFPAQRPVTRSFDVFFDLRLNKRLRTQSWGRWFETLSRPLWRHYNDYWLSRPFGVEALSKTMLIYHHTHTIKWKWEDICRNSYWCSFTKRKYSVSFRLQDGRRSAAGSSKARSSDFGASNVIAVFALLHWILRWLI